MPASKDFSSNFLLFFHLLFIQRLNNRFSSFLSQIFVCFGFVLQERKENRGKSGELVYLGEKKQFYVKNEHILQIRCCGLGGGGWLGGWEGRAMFNFDLQRQPLHCTRPSTPPAHLGDGLGRESLAQQECNDIKYILLRMELDK